MSAVNAEISHSSVMREQHLCIVGVDKHWVEKDMIKYFRKAFNAGSDDKDEASDALPLKGVAKKRGKTFGFL